MSIYLKDPISNKIYIFWNQINLEHLPNVQRAETGYTVKNPETNNFSKPTYDENQVLKTLLDYYPNYELHPFDKFTVLRPIEAIDEIMENVILLSNQSIIWSLTKRNCPIIVTTILRHTCGDVVSSNNLKKNYEKYLNTKNIEPSLDAYMNYLYKIIHKNPFQYSRVKLVDHKGNVYKSLQAYAEYYGFSYHSMRAKLKKNNINILKPIPEFIAIKDKSNGIKITDHKGIAYDSITSYCKAYNRARTAIERKLMRHNIDLSKPIPEWIITKKETNTEVIDHLGNSFENIRTAANHYNLTHSQLSQRLRKHKNKDPQWLELKDVFTRKPYEEARKRGHKIIDHTGKTHNSLSAYSKYYGFDPKTIREKINTHNIDITKPVPEHIVTRKNKQNPTNTRTAIPVIDHEGNSYPSLKKYAAAYNCNYKVIQRKITYNKIDLSKPIPEFIIQKHPELRPNKKITDHLGNTFNSIKEAAKHYNLSYKLLNKRLHKHKNNNPNWVDLEKVFTFKK